MGLDVIKNYDEDNKVWVLKPVGEIDIYTAPEFKKTLLDLSDENNADIIINGESLQYIDSTGLGVLISGLKKQKEKDKSIIIENIKPNINKLFNITGLNKVFMLRGE